MATIMPVSDQWRAGLIHAEFLSSLDSLRETNGVSDFPVTRI